MNAENRNAAEEADVVPTKELLGKVDDKETWGAVAYGVNRVTTTIYLLGNVLVFALYMCPLLYRIGMYSASNGYMVDTE